MYTFVPSRNKLFEWAPGFNPEFDPPDRILQVARGPMKVPPDSAASEPSVHRTGLPFCSSELQPRMGSVESRLEYHFAQDKSDLERANKPI